MFSRTQTTEVLLRWKYVRQAEGRALYTLEHSLLLARLRYSDHERMHRNKNVPGTGTKTKTGTKTQNVVLYEKALILLIC